jgi:hypothetical protein
MKKQSEEERGQIELIRIGLDKPACLAADKSGLAFLR